ncbi:urease accessory protein UreF [Halalkalibacterium halodurans]|uniref:urease accessory protein UreF n=1 Tax=Halalkalibacterium halodurans TaxID=86665 RepID=UPI0010674D78|nr:urease accessory protein UreF [Halalkalibacterium halodurans]TES48814.1 urease accessory protein UreF [Halalkalibacterium halodurans]
MNKRRNGLSSRSSTKGITTITIDPLTLVEMMHIHDSAFPIGGYTHSFGLETYIQRDIVKDENSLIQWCRTYLYDNLGYGDGILLKETLEVLKKSGSLAAIIEIDRLAHAQKLARESREGSLKMGRQFLQTVLSLQEDESLSQWAQLIRAKEAHGHYATTYGVFSYTRAYPDQMTMIAFLYSSVANLVHNAVRAIPLGQSTGVRVIHQLHEDCLYVAQQVVARSLNDLSNHAIGIELASMEHEHLHSRLFIS